MEGIVKTDLNRNYTKNSLQMALCDKPDGEILYSIGATLIESFDLIEDGVKYKRMALYDFINKVYKDETLETELKELRAEPYRLELEALEKLLESRKTSK